MRLHRFACTRSLSGVACAVLAPGIAGAQADTLHRALSFYVAGHQDDWQLFRGNAAFQDLKSPNARVVFIYATAGDAGQTDGWWEARERGAVAAVRKVVGPLPLTVDIAQFLGHPIVRYTSGNSVSYFLRLPDGAFRSGRGYPAYHNESLSQLRDSGKPVSAVDRSTTYRSWKDFWETLRAIADYERSRVPAVTHPRISAPDYFGVDNSQEDCRTRESCNRCDHPDHIAVGQALRKFVTGTYDRVWWVGYFSRTLPENLNGADFLGKGEVFFAYAAAVLNETTSNGKPQPPNLGEWRAWGARDYIRTVGWDRPDPDVPACGPSQ
jgi:hypothetical protein